MKVLHVSAEFFPLLKTGGLADIVGALPKAQMLADPHSDIRILLPGFSSIIQGVYDCEKIIEVHTFAGKITLLLGHFQDMKIYVIQAPHLYARKINPYHNTQMEPYPDNYLAFALLGWIACELACGLLDSLWRPDIVHAHDWHAGLTGAYLEARGKPARSIFTIHNLAYQGVFPAHHFKELHLPIDFFQMQGLEFYGHISYLKAGLFYADHVTTVSPTYAQEITHYDSGFGLHGLLQELQQNDRLTGILNGIDDSVWNPLLDKNIAIPYDLHHLQGKLQNKAKLQKQMELSASSKKLLFCVISRLTEQKGLDWVLAALPRIIEQGGQFILVGTGETWMQEAFLTIAAQYPKQIAVHIGYDDKLAHQVIAGCDVILVPSRFEPCGLTQLYALKYGTLPLVRHTGGLADSVVDASAENLKNKTSTGFVFQQGNVHALENTIGRVFSLWSQPTNWKIVQATAMEQNFSWEIAVKKYSQLYKSLSN